MVYFLTFLGEWKVAKSKDEEDSLKFEFMLEKRILDEDEDGEEISSCVVQPMKDNKDLSLQEYKIQTLRELYKRNQDVYEWFEEAINESNTYGSAGAPSHCRALLRDDFIKVCKQLLPESRDKRNKDQRLFHAKRAIQILITKNLIGGNEVVLWELSTKFEQIF